MDRRASVPVYCKSEWVSIFSRLRCLLWDEMMRILEKSDFGEFWTRVVVIKIGYYKDNNVMI